MINKIAGKSNTNKLTIDKIQLSNNTVLNYDIRNIN